MFDGNLDKPLHVFQHIKFLQKEQMILFFWIKEYSQCIIEYPINNFRMGFNPYILCLLQIWGAQSEKWLLTWGCCAVGANNHPLPGTQAWRAEYLFEF